MISAYQESPLTPLTRWYEYSFMRVTIDLPDKLHRKVKAVAASRGSSMKTLVIGALQRELTEPEPTAPKGEAGRVRSK